MLIKLYKINIFHIIWCYGWTCVFKHTRFDSTGADRERFLHFNKVSLDASKTKISTNLTQANPKIASGLPKMAQKLPRWLWVLPKWSQDDTRIAQNAPKVEQSSNQCITKRFTNRFKVRDPRSKVQGSESRVQKRVGGPPKGLQLLRSFYKLTIFNNNSSSISLARRNARSRLN